jgi:hypothetical protein
MGSSGLMKRRENDGHVTAVYSLYSPFNRELKMTAKPADMSTQMRMDTNAYTFQFASQDASENRGG